MGRAPCCEKVGLKRGRWTAEEDEILTKYIQAHGDGSWRSLPKKAGLLRCGKSCRLRWINYLRTDLKRGNITPEEEEAIVKFHRALGNRWSLIAAHLPGRTDNEIKNYWNIHLSRKLYGFTRDGREPLTTVMNITTIADACKRKGGWKCQYTKKRNNNSTSSSAGVLEQTAKEKTGPSSADAGNVEDRKQEKEGRKSLTVDRGVGEESSTMFALSQCMERKAETLGPHEWFHGEMESFNYILQSEYPSGNHAVINDRENGVMGTDLMTETEGREGNSSNAAESSNWCSFSSSMNSGSDDAWTDWDFACGIECNNQWGERGEMLSWLWSGIECNNQWGERGEMLSWLWSNGEGDNFY